MHIEFFSAVNFRNLREVSFEPHARFNIFEGKNGQGKTNLLEGIYTLAHFKSFRESKSSDLIRFDHDLSQVTAKVRHHEILREIEVQTEKKGRRIKLDGKAPSRLSAALGQVSIVFFGPDDLVLTKSGPKNRRVFLDRAILNLWSAYFDEARAYQQALRARNKLLKSRTASSEVMEVFDEQFTNHAARVVWRRQKFVHQFAPFFREVLAEMTDGALLGTVKYNGQEAQLDEDQIRLQLREELAQKRPRDQQVGYTTLGPHTHDLACELNGHPLRRVASQGQHRAFVLALRIAQMKQVHQEHGFYPILLLDDVSSELDKERNGQLMRYLDEAGGQVFITTTDREWIQIESRVSHYRVHDGAIV